MLPATRTPASQRPLLQQESLHIPNDGIILGQEGGEAEPVPHSHFPGCHRDPDSLCLSYPERHRPCQGRGMWPRGRSTCARLEPPSAGGSIDPGASVHSRATSRASAKVFMVWEVLVRALSGQPGKWSPPPPAVSWPHLPPSPWKAHTPVFLVAVPGHNLKSPSFLPYLRPPPPIQASASPLSPSHPCPINEGQLCAPMTCQPPEPGCALTARPASVLPPPLPAQSPSC